MSSGDTELTFKPQDLHNLHDAQKSELSPRYLGCERHAVKYMTFRSATKNESREKIMSFICVAFGRKAVLTYYYY